MRAVQIGLLILLALAGCVSDDCLPEPRNDPTPPQLSVVVNYTAPGAQTESTREIAWTDSASTVIASRTRPLRVTFVASDSSGLRRLAPAVTVQETVGIGVERSFPPIDAVESACPVPISQTEYEAHTSGRARVLIVSAIAENWMGTRSSIEPVSIRMQ